MHDIKAIREETEAFDAAIMRRPDIDTSELLRFLKDVKEHADAFETVGALDFENGVQQTPGEILRLIDLNRRRLIAEAEQHAGNANKFAKRAGQAKASGDQETFQAIIRTANSYKEEAKQIEAARSAVDDILERALLTLPNLPLPDVPDGADEGDNVEIRRRGTPPEFDFTPLEHFDIPAAKHGMDFETAAKLAGSRFALLSGAVARVHRALAQFMLDVHTTENGLTEVMPPVLVRDEAMLGTGQLPKFAEDSYVTTNGWWLIPTSEVPLTNIVAGLIVDEDDLPRRYTAHTLCFRSEAGSAGKDTAGMLRQHQFEKVEMVSITHPDRSLDEHERMTRCAEDILERLGLPYRTVVLCTGDMGFGARKTHDIEVWLPGQNTYREISSVSVCGDFQARRMNARFRPAGGGKPEFVHTLNGSGLAVGRCLIAVLENGQQADGSVLLPDVLGPWLGGKTRIGADGQLV